MFTIRSVSIALVLGFLAGLTARAADSPVSIFPKETGLIVRLQNPQQTMKDLGDLAVKVDRQQGIKVQMAMPILGTMISNPMLKGVDLQSDWWLAVFPAANADPGVVFCIPATDADAMKQAITGNYQFQTFEKWVIYTEHADAAATIKKQIADKGDSIATLLDQTSQGIWDEGNVSVFVNVPHLLKVYQGPFEQGVKQVEDLIEQLPAMIPPQQGGVDMKIIADMYAGMFKTLVQGVKDARGCVAAFSVSPDVAALNEYVQFAADSATAKHLAAHQPSKLEMLSQLPANRLGYGAAELDMADLIQWSTKFSLQMYAQNDTEKEKQAEKLIAEYEKLKFGGIAAAFGLGDVKKGAMRMFAIVEAENPQAIRDLAKKSSELMSTYNFGGMKMKATYQPEAETYGDLKADITKVEYEFDQQADQIQTQMQAKMNEMLYGPEGMVTRTFYLKDRLVQVVGGDKADAQTLLDALNGQKTIGDQPAFQSTRKQLLDQANLVGLIDLPATIASGLELAVQAGAPVPFGENDLKAIRGETSFLGFSLAVKNNGLQAKTVVPVQQMQGIARFVQTIQKLEQQGL